MKKALFSWIGRTDLRAPLEGEEIGLGPIAQAVTVRHFDSVRLISDYPEHQVKPFLIWLQSKTSAAVSVRYVQLSSPTHFGEIYQAITSFLREYTDNNVDDLTFHLSPGTPAMAAVWILLAKSIWPAQLIESSLEKGVEPAEIPFDISAEYIPNLLRKTDQRVTELSSATAPESAAFVDIVHRSHPMQRVVARAQQVASREVPVLIEGESGTGKELFAKAIHQASHRTGKPFVAVNCGAIPSELIEGELFGYKKGAFTGAVENRPGYFEVAHEGTLFLDEIGELPLVAQVKILRVLQEGKVTRLGETDPRPAKPRIIAATNRSLIEEVGEGRFRTDLFYRLAVAVLHLPPLRDRQGDIGLLIDHLLEQALKQGVSNTKQKKISPSAKNLLVKHAWPGNVRELQNTLTRAVVWSTSEEISLEDALDALLPTTINANATNQAQTQILPVNLPELLGKTAKDYLGIALQKTGGNKTRAAELLGLPNYQTLSNWMKKHGIDQ